MRVSNTQISMYSRCPRQYEFRYIKGMKKRPSGAMVQGSAYHKALETNFKQKIETQKDLPEADVLDAFVTYWRKHAMGEVPVVEDGEQEIVEEVDWEGNNPDALKSEGLRIVRLYHQTISPDTQPTKAEQKYIKAIGDDEYIGYVDLETKESIVDHKLRGRKMAEADAKKDIQPLSYCMLTGKRKFTYHVATKTKTPDIQILPLEKTDADVEWWLRGVKQYLAAIKAGVFPPNTTSFLCNEKFCGYWENCKGMV